MINKRQILKRGLEMLRQKLSSMSFPQVVRFFTARKKKYIDLIARMNSFISVIEATASVKDTDAYIVRNRGIVGLSGVSRRGAIKEIVVPKEPTHPGAIKEIVVPKEPTHPGVRGIQSTTIDITGEPTFRPKTSTQRAKTGTQKTLVDGSLRLSTFEVPKRVDLAKDTKLLAEAEASLDELEVVISRFSSMRDKSSKDFAAQVQEMYDTINAKAEETSDALQELSYKHEPEVMKDIRKGVYKHIVSSLAEGTYGEISNDLYITSHDAILGNEDSNIQFTCYIYLPDLDDDMYKNGDLTIILSGVVGIRRGNKNYSLMLYITSLNTTDPRKMPPGSFDIGEKVEGSDVNSIIKNANNEVDKLLSLNRLVPMIGKAKLDRQVTQQALRNTPIIDHPEVVDVDVADDNIFVHLKEGVTEAKATKIFDYVVRQLYSVPGLVRGGRKAVNSFVYTVQMNDEGDLMLVINKKRSLHGR